MKPSAWGHHTHEGRRTVLDEVLMIVLVVTGHGLTDDAHRAEHEHGKRRLDNRRHLREKPVRQHKLAAVVVMLGNAEGSKI